MSCDRIAVVPVQTIKTTCSQSTHSRISVELDSHAYTCVVGSNILVFTIMNALLIFTVLTRQQDTPMPALLIPQLCMKTITNSTLILMINQAMNSVWNILVCPNKCPKFLSASPAKDNHALRIHIPDRCNPPLTITLSLGGVTSYFEARWPSLLECEDKNIPKYHLTSKSWLWDPSTSFYSLQEDSIVNRSQILMTQTWPWAQLPWPLTWQLTSQITIILQWS